MTCDVNEMKAMASCFLFHLLRSSLENGFDVCLYISRSSCQEATGPCARHLLNGQVHPVPMTDKGCTRPDNSRNQSPILT